MSIEDMNRRMAQRWFKQRIAKIKEDFRSLPAGEKFRCVAEMIDTGQTHLALSVAKLALADLTDEVGNTGAPTATKEPCINPDCEDGVIPHPDGACPTCDTERYISCPDCNPGRRPGAGG